MNINFESFTKYLPSVDFSALTDAFNNSLAQAQISATDLYNNSQAFVSQHAQEAKTLVLEQWNKIPSEITLSTQDAVKYGLMVAVAASVFGKAISDYSKQQEESKQQQVLVYTGRITR